MTGCSYSVNSPASNPSKGAHVDGFGPTQAKVLPHGDGRKLHLPNPSSCLSTVVGLETSVVNFGRHYKGHAAK